MLIEETKAYAVKEICFLFDFVGIEMVFHKLKKKKRKKQRLKFLKHKGNNKFYLKQQLQ